MKVDLPFSVFVQIFASFEAQFTEKSNQVDMFVLLRIRKGCSIIKDWYGVKRACENLTFADLFDEFRNGTLDSSTPIDINSSVRYCLLWHILCCPE